MSARTAYADVNGLRVYYEVHGSGEPLVLLHGGVSGIIGIQPLLGALAAGREVIAVELQGHGRTADVDRPLSYEALAGDVAAVMSQLSLERADWMGYSLGGGVALAGAIHHPEKVRKLVLVSTTFAHDGWYPEVMEAFRHMGPAAAAGMKESPLAQIYPNVDWGVLFTKLGTLQSGEYDFSKRVAAMKGPAMLVYADADSVRPEHIVEFWKMLGGGRRDAGLDGSQRPSSRLAILPGHTHYDVAAAPALPGLVEAFLSA